MRLATLLLIMAFALLSLAGHGQIMLKEKNAPLERILSAIEKQTPYVFLYDPDELRIAPLTVDIKGRNLQETLEKCFKGLPVTWTVVGNNVLLKLQLPDSGAKPGKAAVIITGMVVDQQGLPMAGVTVIKKHGSAATQTDTSGAFTLAAAKGDVLSFSFVGYKGKDVMIGEERSITVALEISPFNPAQVIVIGYGSARKRDLTGSVSVVNMRGMAEIPFNTVDNALAGRSAGVEVTKTDGMPGGMARIRVRGSSSLLGGNAPLYVIDGIPVQVRNNFIDPGVAIGSPMANLVGAFGGGGNAAALSAAYVNGLNSIGGINPEDIESITILKDASSAAIYGSKAANGVVIITTKAGNLHTPARVSVYYSSSFISPYRVPKVLDAAQYKMLITEAARNNYEDAVTAGAPVDDLTNAVLNDPTYFGTASNNWVKNVTRNVLANNAGMTVSGGERVSKYFASVSYNNTPGVVENTGFRRMTGKLKMETQAGSKLTFSANFLSAFTDQQMSNGAYAQALLARPDWPARDVTGNYTDFGLQGPSYYGFINPAALLTATNTGKTLSILASISGSYAFRNDLHFKSIVSLNKQDYDQLNFVPSYIGINGGNGNTANPAGIGSSAAGRFADWFLENTLSYKKQFSKSELNIVAGHSYETTKYSYFRVTAAGYPNNNTLTSLSSATDVISVAGDEPSHPQAYLLSFYARLNYGFMDKYLLTFTGRTDGSSKFGPNNKFGYFPSGAVAWRISREHFMAPVRWITDLKLRASYGLTGNQTLADQLYRTLYQPASYGGNAALISTQLGNQAIKWETTKQADAGLDLSLLSGRLYGTLDYYNRQTNSNLISVPIASSSSYAGLLKNIIGFRNRGFEATLGGEIIHNKQFRWSASINITWNNSLVTRLDPRIDLSQLVSPSGLESIPNSINIYSGNTGLFQGQPFGWLIGRYITGIIKTKAELDAYNSQAIFFLAAHQPGDVMFLLDTTAPAGVRGPQERVPIGNGRPACYGGMTQEFSYKRFTLTADLSFSQGGHLLWAEHAASRNFFGTANAAHTMLDRYTAANTNSHQQRVTLQSPAFSTTNLEVFSSSYLKCRSMTLSYHVQQPSGPKRSALRSVEVFLSATNVFTLTKYPGGDPETSDDPYSAVGGYMDVANYPSTRTITVGLKAIF